MISKEILATDPDPRRRELTVEIRTHAAGARSERLHPVRVRHAVACGRALLQLRELLGHGEWARWVKEQCVLSRATANRYMRLSKNTERLTRFMTIREAYLAAGVIRCRGRSDSKEVC